MTDRTWFWATSHYMHASEASAWDKICSQPPAIVAACNRVQRRTERALSLEWWKGIAYALSAVLVAGGAVWVWMR